MVKPFETYQNLGDGILTDRDRKATGSKFWNKGKWDNFIAPHLPLTALDDHDSVPKGMSFVDMGCNAGLFLHLATQAGFEKVIGVDSDHAAIVRGMEWRDQNKENYTMIESTMEKAIDTLPIVDYTVFCNSHYYITINDWVDYLDKLRLKTKRVIIVTAEKHHINRCWASADVGKIRGYFKDWKEVSFVNELPTEGDPDPRRLWSLCFESPCIEKVDIELLDSSNHVQDNFYRQLDEGRHYTKTGYYHVLEKYRRKWGQERLHKWMEERLRIYGLVKQYGQTQAILVDDGVLILDGNHRYSMLKTLGHKTIYIRRV